MAGVEGPRVERGRFYVAKAPAEPTPVTFRFFGKEKQIGIAFTLEEFRHIQKAHDAVTDPAFVQVAMGDSHLRGLLSYCAIPWGFVLQDRTKALSAMGISYHDAVRILESPPAPELADAVRTVADNLLPFLPPENPPIRER